jgi:hypothetical protein
MQVDADLDTLVAKNFDKLYHASRSEYNEIWTNMSRELYTRYGLLEHRDSNDKETKRRVHYLSMAIEIYSEEEFPHELQDDRTYRFVMQYGKLPKQASDEWEQFELKQRVEEGRERKEDRERFNTFLRQYAAEHPPSAR